MSAPYPSDLIAWQDQSDADRVYLTGPFEPSGKTAQVSAEVRGIIRPGPYWSVYRESAHPVRTSWEISRARFHQLEPVLKELGQRIEYRRIDGRTPDYVSRALQCNAVIDGEICAIPFPQTAPRNGPCPNRHLPSHERVVGHHSERRAPDSLGHSIAPPVTADPIPLDLDLSQQPTTDP